MILRMRRARSPPRLRWQVVRPSWFYGLFRHGSNLLAFVLALCELVLGTCNLEKSHHVMQKKCANQKGQNASAKTHCKKKCKSQMPEKCQCKSAVCIFCMFFHFTLVLGFFFRNHICAVSPVFFFHCGSFPYSMMKPGPGSQTSMLCI